MAPRFIVDTWKGFGGRGDTHFVVDTHRFGFQVAEGLTLDFARRIAKQLSRRGAWRAAAARDRQKSLRIRWGKGPWKCRRCKEQVMANMYHHCRKENT